jgi:hypothetical protein
VRQYLREVEEQNPVEEPVHEQDQVSTTDPDSTYATKGGTDSHQLVAEALGDSESDLRQNLAEAIRGD